VYLKITRRFSCKLEQFNKKGEDKAFIEILYLIIGYGLRGLIREFPVAKDEQVPIQTLIGQSPRRCLYKEISSASMVVVYHTHLYSP